MEPQTTQSTITPDEQTIDRIRNLAIVGKAMMSRSNDSTYQTDYFLAKESLKNFKAGLDKLQLDAESAKGMDDLVAYLDMKIDKRLDSNIHMTPLV